MEITKPLFISRNAADVLDDYICGNRERRSHRAENSVAVERLFIVFYSLENTSLIASR